MCGSKKSVLVALTLVALTAVPGGAQVVDGSGVTLELAYTGESMSNVVGGVERGSVFLDNIDVVLTIDAAQLFGWSGATLMISALGNRGGSPSDLVGDAQGVSNIDTDDTWKIFEAHVDQSLFGDKLSLLFGLYDLNSEFDAIETAGLFPLSSHGIGPDYSQTGLNGPSIFPTTSLAFRVRIQPSDAFQFQAVVLDAVSGDPDNPLGTHVSWSGDEGVMVGAEFAISTGTGEGSTHSGRFALGGFWYSSDFDCFLADDQGAPQTSGLNAGVYVLGEHTLSREPGTDSQGLAAYARVGLANPTVNQFDSYYGAGFVYTGAFAGRDEDQFGISVAIAHNGSDFRQLQLLEGSPVDQIETILELTYNAPLSEMLFVQPDVQFVINPGTDPGLDHALVLGIRAGVAF